MSDVNKIRCSIDEINDKYSEIDKAREEHLNTMFDKIMSDQRKSLEKLDESVNKFDDVCKNIIDSTEKVSKKINRMSIGFVVLVTLIAITLISLALIV